MSPKLTLIPLRKGRKNFERERVLVPDQRIYVDTSDEGFIKEIAQFESEPLPEGKRILLSDKKRYATIDTTPNGKRITYVYRIAFSRISNRTPRSPWNKAVLAFAKNLPDDIPILLYWD